MKIGQRSLIDPPILREIRKWVSYNYPEYFMEYRQELKRCFYGKQSNLLLWLENLPEKEGVKKFSSAFPEYSIRNKKRCSIVPFM